MSFVIALGLIFVFLIWLSIKISRKAIKQPLIVISILLGIFWGFGIMFELGVIEEPEESKSSHNAKLEETETTDSQVIQNVADHSGLNLNSYQSDSSQIAIDTTKHSRDKQKDKDCSIDGMFSSIFKATFKRGDLSGRDFSGIDFTQNSTEGVLSGRGSFRDMNLTEANFELANLKRASFRGAKLERAIFREANLRKADLTGVDLRGADLRGADLREADMENTDLRCADLTDVDLRCADLGGADLTGANLTRAKLNCEGTYPEHSPSLYGTNLSNTDLREVNLTGVDLRWGVNLTGADLTDVKLNDALFRSCPFLPNTITAGRREKCFPINRDD